MPPKLTSKVLRFWINTMLALYSLVNMKVLYFPVCPLLMPRKEVSSPEVPPSYPCILHLTSFQEFPVQQLVSELSKYPALGRTKCCFNPYEAAHTPKGPQNKWQTWLQCSSSPLLLCFQSVTGEEDSASVRDSSSWKAMEGHRLAWATHPAPHSETWGMEGTVHIHTQGVLPEIKV